MNLPLLLIDIALIAFGLCAWFSPDLLDKHSRYSKARAAALRKSRKVYRSTFDGAVGQRTRVQPVVIGRAQRCFQSRIREFIGRAAGAVGAIFGLVLIGACIAALVMMPQ